MRSQAPSPWYHHRWPWFIVAVLGISVVLSLAMLALALNGQDSPVPDRYYDAGKGVARDLAADVRAQQLDQRAELTFDSLTGEVRLRLSGGSQPDSLQLNLIAATQAERDLHLRLSRAFQGQKGISEYRGQLSEAVSGRFTLELLGASREGEWRCYERKTVVPDRLLTLGAEPVGGAPSP